jgi:PKD repeat protein
MASPHVAGAAALYLQGNPTASPVQVTNALLGNATTNHLSGLNGSPNLLLFVGSSSGGGGGGGGGGSPPTANLTKACSGFTCTFTFTSSGATSGPTWNFTNGSYPANPDPGQNTVTYARRSGGSVSVTVGNSFGETTVTQNVSCNPVKCQ